MNSKPHRASKNIQGFGLLDILFAGSLLVLALGFSMTAIRSSGESQLKSSYSATLDTSLRYLEDDLSSTQSRFAHATEGTTRVVSGVEMLEYFESQGGSLLSPDAFSATVRWSGTDQNALGYQGLAKFKVQACLLESCKTRTFEASVPVYVIPSTATRTSSLSIDVSGPGGLVPNARVITADEREYTIDKLGRTRLTFNGPTNAVVRAENVTLENELTAEAVVTRLSSSNFRIVYAVKEGYVTLPGTGGITFSGSPGSGLQTKRFTGPGRFALKVGEYSLTPDSQTGMNVTVEPEQINLRAGESITIQVRSSVSVGTIAVDVQGAGALTPLVTLVSGSNTLTQVGSGVLSATPGTYTVVAESLASPYGTRQATITPSQIQVTAGQQSRVAVNYPPAVASQTGIAHLYFMGFAGFPIQVINVNDPTSRYTLSPGRNSVPVGQYRLGTGSGVTTSPTLLNVTRGTTTPWFILPPN